MPLQNADARKCLVSTRASRVHHGPDPEGARRAHHSRGLAFALEAMEAMEEVVHGRVRGRVHGRVHGRAPRVHHRAAGAIAHLKARPRWEEKMN